MELKIVLLGKRGAGKSATGNTILGHAKFHTSPWGEGVTQNCSSSSCTVNGDEITVVDTPGWCDVLEPQVIQDTFRAIELCETGPHVFLLVLPIGRFTQEIIKTAQNIQDFFGEEANKYTMVLFTRGDDLEDKTIEDYLEGANPELKQIMEKCWKEYQVFNNRDQDNKTQVSQLLRKAKALVAKNNNGCFTTTMFKTQLENYLKIQKSTENIKTKGQNDGKQEVNMQNPSPNTLQQGKPEAVIENPQKKNMTEESRGEEKKVTGGDRDILQSQVVEEEQSKRVRKQSNEAETEDTNMCHIGVQTEEHNERQKGKMEFMLQEQMLELQRAQQQKEWEYMQTSKNLEKEKHILEIKLAEKEGELEMVKRDRELLQEKLRHYEETQRMMQKHSEELQKLKRGNIPVQDEEAFEGHED